MLCMTFSNRWVDEKLEANEEFLGLYKVNCTNAESLTKTIKDVLLLTGIPLAQCRGQCYDDASVMSGLKGGVATKIQQVHLQVLRAMLFTSLLCTCWLINMALYY